MKKETKKDNKTSWCFAIINGKLGGIFFQKGKGTKGIKGHYYVKREEYSAYEQKMIDTDIQKCRLIYRNKKYTEEK